MFTISTNTFVIPAEISKPIDNLNSVPQRFLANPYFDMDGFQLNPVEQQYYHANRIPVDECLGVVAAQYPWIIKSIQNNYIVDHSFVVTRCNYTGEARQQLEEFVATRPWMRKMLLLQPKWGIDFALEYYNQEDYIEVIHIEQDYNNYEEAQQAKELIEQRIICTDWDEFTKVILSRKHEWAHLQGMARNDWKARYWGLDRAEHTLKAF
jgi:hypothetical protein